MKLLTGLFMAAKRRLMTTDSNSDSFKSKLDELSRTGRTGRVVCEDYEGYGGVPGFWR